MSSRYLDEDPEISQEISVIRLQIYRRFYNIQHNRHTKSRVLSTAFFFICYTRTAVPLTATINIPSRTTS